MTDERVEVLLGGAGELAKILLREERQQMQERIQELENALRLVWDSTAVLNHLDREHIAVIGDALRLAKGE